MNEPLSSGPQEPIDQSSMKTTPPNTEKEHVATLSEIETGSSMLDLQQATYHEKVVVIASVVVNDTSKVDVTKHLDINILEAEVTFTPKMVVTPEVNVTSTVPPKESIIQDLLQ